MELMIGRYKEPVELEVVARYAVRERKARPRKPWRLKDSIWAPRAKWADSKDFWDTDATERAMFEGDWADAVACGISKYILRMDDDDDEVSSHGEDDEVSETMGVLWQYHDLLYTIFDYYAATGSGDDFTQIRMNSFREFVNDCALADKHSKFCKPTHFDQLFIAADASGAGKKTDEKYNSKKALNRQEWLQCLVKIAVMRYVQPGEVVDVSEAVHRLLSVDIERRLDPKLFVEPNDFRTRFAYCEEVDASLRKHEGSLRLLYDATCRLQGPRQKLITFESWRDFCRTFDLIDVDLTERDMTLAFVWSRMRVIDDQSDLGRTKLMHLSFEDFLEALCRCAACKAWPTREEMEAAGATNAGAYLWDLRTNTPDEYMSLLSTRAVPWGSEPRQDLAACADHLCTVLVARCQRNSGANEGNNSGAKEGDGTLNEKEVGTFMGVKM